MCANVYRNIRDLSQTFANVLHYTLGWRVGWEGVGELYVKEIAHISQKFYCEGLHEGDHPQPIYCPCWWALWHSAIAWQGDRMANSSPHPEFLAFCLFKPYVDSVSFWWVFYSWTLNPGNREWCWKHRPPHNDSRQFSWAYSWVSDYSIELQKGLLLSFPPLDLLIYSGLLSLNSLSHNFCL